MRTLTVVSAVLALAAACHAQENLLPNPSFEEGVQAPAGWAPDSDACSWSEVARTGARALAVTGDGSDTTFWRTDDPGLEAGRLYEFSTWMRRGEGPGGGGIAITGPSWANRDVSVGADWSRTAHVFVPPTRDDPGYVRVGHWRERGTLLFDDAAIVPVSAVSVRRGALALGEGEAIEGGAYTCRAPLGGYAGNYSRALHAHTATLNTHRWVFAPGAEVVYRHEVGGVPLTAATVTISIGWYAAGACHVEASRDGAQWTEIGTRGELGEVSFAVPEALLPADALFVRLRSPGEGEARADSAPGSFQVYSYELRAELAEELEPLIGGTTFLIEERRSDRLAVEPITVGGPTPGGPGLVELVLRNPGGAALTGTAIVELATGEQRTETRTPISVPAGGEAQATVAYVADRVGSYDAAIVVADAAGEELYRARFSLAVPELYRADFGYALSSDAAADLWWCEGTYKVNRERAAPTQPGPEVRLEAARGEFEPVQVVVRPTRDLTGLTASVGELSGPGGATIPAEAIDILRVAYHFVHTPTDAQGAVGWWPDALPPLDAPIDLAAGQNQPLWLRVQVPRDAAPGEYRGTLRLAAQGWSAEAPLALRVYDFEMPAESGLVATMGLSAGEIRRYHHLRTDEQLAQVFEQYMQSFRDHRIDPYSPWLAGPSTQVVGIAWSGGAIEAADDAPEGGHVLRVEDASATANPAAAPAALMPVDRTQAHRLSFMARAEAGHEFQTTVACHNAAGAWMSGCNVDTVHAGTGGWERYEVAIPAGRLAEGCVAVNLSLRPTRWVDPGVTTGSANFDDVFLGEAAPGAANLLADGGFEGGDGQARIAVDFSAWDRWLERYVDGMGMQSFRLPIGYMPGRGTPGRVGPYEQGSAAYERIVGEYLHTLQEHLREKGWLDAAYAYWVDEPEPGDYENVQYGMRMLDEHAPDIRRMLTEQPEPELFGYVDTWCPVLHYYEETACRARQAAGEEIWWYVCTGPKAPWPGLFIDHNAIDLRIWQWMTWKYDVQGILVWQVSYWNSPERARTTGALQDPWADPMGWRAEGGGGWGNGDGRFLYPPNVDPNAEHEPILSGPVDSIRWEMLREGLEDWECFRALDRRLQGLDDPRTRALLEIPESIVTDTREFTRDPQPLYAHRRAVLEALERLGE